MVRVSKHNNTNLFAFFYFSTRQRLKGKRLLGLLTWRLSLMSSPNYMWRQWMVVCLFLHFLVKYKHLSFIIFCLFYNINVLLFTILLIVLQQPQINRCTSECIGDKALQIQSTYQVHLIHLVYGVLLSGVCYWFWGD